MDWVILGGITGFVFFIFAIIKFKDYRFDRKEKKLNELPIEDVAFTTILQEYNSSTPYQRKRFRTTYKGIKVKWHIEYHAIADTFKMGKVGMVMSFSDKKKFQYVNFKTDFKKFPMIKSAKSGDNFYVTGLIDKVEGSTVYLKLIKIEKDTFFIF